MTVELKINVLATPGIAKRGRTRERCRPWLRENDHFDWLALYLNTRGIRLIWRAMIAAVICLIAITPVVVLVRPTVPHYPATVVVAPVTAASA